MTIIRAITVATILAAGFAAAAPAAAAIATFANYTTIGGVNLMWKKTGTNALNTGGNLYTISTPSSTTAGAVAVKFNFQNLPYLPALGPLDAGFTFNAIANPGTAAGSLFGIFDVQPLSSGSFSFIYKGPNFVVGQTHYHTNDNLLTATFFTGGAIAGQDNSTSGSVGAATSTGGTTITYTSDFLNFGGTHNKDFAISLSSITPTLGLTTGLALNTFKASSAGLFSTDPVPLTTAIIPEPATWGMLVVGFGLVGINGRRRSRLTSVAA